MSRLLHTDNTQTVSYRFHNPQALLLVWIMCLLYLAKIFIVLYILISILLLSVLIIFFFQDDDRLHDFNAIHKATQFIRYAKLQVMI